MLNQKVLGSSSGALEFGYISSTENATPSTALVINKPEGTVSGVLLVAWIACSYGPITDNPSPPAGWSILGDYVSGFSKGRGLAYYKTAGASEPSTYTFTTSTALISGSIAAFGAAQIGFSTGCTLGNASSQLVLPELTVPVDCILITAAALDASDTLTGPSGMTRIQNGADPATSYDWHYQTVSAGATGTRTYTSATTSWAGTSFCILPDSYSPPVTSFIGSSAKANTSTNASLTINNVSGATTGDLLVAVMCSDDTAGSKTWTGDTGWTEVGDQGVPPGMRVAYKSWTSDASFTFTFNSSTNRLVGIVLAFRGLSYDAIGTLDDTITGSAVNWFVSGPTIGANWASVLSFIATSVASGGFRNDEGFEGLRSVTGTTLSCRVSQLTKVAAAGFNNTKLATVSSTAGTYSGATFISLIPT